MKKIEKAFMPSYTESLYEYAIGISDKLNEIINVLNHFIEKEENRNYGERIELSDIEEV